jgi:enoyl-CoA hydratase/carnithine racemase
MSKVTRLEEYAAEWADFAVLRREEGILEVRLHTRGGSALWSQDMEDAIIWLFQNIDRDPENECLILTGTGEEFLNTWDPERFSYPDNSPRSHEMTYTRMYQPNLRLSSALLSLGIPVVSAINGAVGFHPEIVLLGDLVICTDSTTFAERHFARHDFVPADGCHLIWRELLGPNRARFFSYTGQVMDAGEALRLGVVGEVVPDAALNARAWELARTVFMKASRPERLFSRSIMVQPWREIYAREQASGLAHLSWAATAKAPGVA